MHGPSEAARSTNAISPRDPSKCFRLHLHTRPSSVSTTTGMDGWIACAARVGFSLGQAEIDRALIRRADARPSRGAPGRTASSWRRGPGTRLPWRCPPRPEHREPAPAQPGPQTRCSPALGVSWLRRPARCRWLPRLRSRLHGPRRSAASPRPDHLRPAAPALAAPRIGARPPRPGKQTLRHARCRSCLGTEPTPPAEARAPPRAAAIAWRQIGRPRVPASQWPAPPRPQRQNQASPT